MYRLSNLTFVSSGAFWNLRNLSNVVDALWWMATGLSLIEQSPTMGRLLREGWLSELDRFRLSMMVIIKQNRWRAPMPRKIHMPRVGRKKSHG